MDQGTPALNKALLVPLIIVIAMVPGLLALSGIAWYLGNRMDGVPEDAEIILLVAVALTGVASIAVYQLVRRSLVGRLVRAADAAAGLETMAARAFATFLQLTIVGAALAEGFGLFGAIAMLVTGNELALAAPPLAILALVAQIPTLERFRRFIEDAVRRRARSGPDSGAGS